MIDDSKVLASFDPRRLNLFILPTERCNFRCSYCYEDFKIGTMKPSVVKGIKNLIAQRADDLSLLEISWFGGEPLLAKKVIYEISEHIESLKDAHQLEHRAGMTTNGYFLDASTFANLISLGITSFQISLDGPERSHNLSRRLANGGQTFDAIWKNLVECKREKRHFNIMLRVHFSADTLKEAFLLTHLINKEFGSDQRFSIFFKGIEKLGGKNDDKIQTLSKAALKEALDELKGASSLSTHDIKADSGCYICYASKPNSLVIRANGRIAKCTVDFFSEKNDIGVISPSGKVELDQDKVRWWMRGFLSQNEFELGCPYGADKAKKIASLPPAPNLYV